MPLQQFDEKNSVNSQVQFGSSYVPGTPEQVWNTGAVSSRLDRFTVVNQDTIDHNVEFELTVNDGLHPTAIATVPAGAGTGLVPPFDLLGFAFPSGMQFVLMAGYDYTSVQLQEAVSVGKTVTVTASGGTF